MARGEQDRGYRRTRRSGLTSPALPTGEAQWILGNDLPFLWSLTMPAARREGQETGTPGEDVQLDAEDEEPFMFWEDFLKPKRRDAHCSLGERSALFFNNKG